MNVMIKAFICMVTIMAPVASYADATADECRELLLAYFPEPFVRETLKKFNVPEDKWDAIQKQLADKDKEVIKTVEKRAAQLDTNPLEDRQTAVKLFKETLLQVFTDVMKDNGITDNAKIEMMLKDMNQQKAQRFAKCMQKLEVKDNIFKESPQVEQPPEVPQEEMPAELKE